MDRQQGRRVPADHQHRFRPGLISTALFLALHLLPPIDSAAPPYPARELAPGVFAVVGDTGRGSEGRPNAGFVVTSEGVLVIDALASPAQGERLLATIQAQTREPVHWLVLTHHHPDHHFGGVVLRRAGARVMAHPERRTLAAEAGEDALVADWTGVVGVDAMAGFEFANRPDRPVTGSDTLRIGGRTVVVFHPGAAHTPGDLVVWLPEERVLFAGDLLIEDGISMVVDGDSRLLLAALGKIDSLGPRVLVPGHGAIPVRPGSLLRATRGYLTGLQAEMRAAVEKGLPMQRALATLPPPDPNRPVSLNSRKRRNAVRVYLEEERRYMGIEPSP